MKNYRLCFGNWLASVLALSIFTVSPAQANDSNAAIGLGGLELIQNEDISMDSEDLFLSMKGITVKYEFTNTSKRDITTLVSFPLPAIPDAIEGHMGDVGYPDWKKLDFQTKVNGTLVELEYREVIESDVENIEAEIINRGWPVKYWNDYNFQRKLQDLPDSEKKKLLDTGLVEKLGNYGGIRPAWSLAAHITRQQTFPAGQTVTVEHSYKPLLGGTNGGNMSKYARTNPDYGFDWFQKTFCINDDFIAGFDAIYKSRGKDKREQYVETFLDYRLSPGANWKGPIKKFRLVVDKGTARDLVSFCMDGVKKISPTQFEVMKDNFEPGKDLKILIVRWFNFP